MTAVIHKFERKASYADTDAVRLRAEEVLTARIEAHRFTWTERGGQDDRLGVDVWATLPSSERVGVELKVNAYGEVRIEYLSRQAEGIVGWTVNDGLISDYVLYLWMDSRLSFLVDYPQLRRVAKEQRKRYVRLFGDGAGGPRLARSSGRNGHTWTTEFVAVPLGIVLQDIFGHPVMGMPLTPARECPVCHLMHPVGTTCAGGWAPWPEQL